MALFAIGQYKLQFKYLGICTWHVLILGESKWFLIVVAVFLG